MKDSIKNNARAIASRYGCEVNCLQHRIYVGKCIIINAVNWTISIEADNMDWDEHTRLDRELDCARCIVGVMNLS